MAENVVDLNTATVDELQQLPGIGPTLAGRIIAYRETVHPFEEPVELTAVPGISERMYQAIARCVSVGGVGAGAAPGVPVLPVEAPAPAPEPPPVPRAERALVTLPAWAGPDPDLPPDTPPRAVPAPPPRAEPPAARPWWGCLGLTVATLLGGLWGALLALLVIGGINGTLDFGQAEAVLSSRSDLDRLSAQAEVLQADVDGLRQRLDGLEGLTGRMDGVEQAVDGLSGGLDQAELDLAALDARADQLGSDVDAVRAAADRFDTFLDGLRDLLFAFQGAPPTPTATPTPLPTATPASTRTPLPTPTVPTPVTAVP